MSTGLAVQPQAAPERCPWCGTTVSRTKFIEIQARISDQERKKLTEERARMEQEFRTERQRAEAHIRAEAEKKLAALTTERDQAASKIKALEAREAAIRKEAATHAETRIKAETDKKLAALTTERDQAASKIKELEAREAAIRKEAGAQAEARIRAETDKKLSVLTTEREQAASKIRQLEAREVAIRKEAAAQAEARIKVETDRKLAALTTERNEATAKVKKLEVATQNDLDQQRRALEKDRDTQLLKLQVQHNRDREQLQQKIDGLTRQVQRKTADQLGEGAEIDVYEALRNAYSHDDIARIKKGQPGADIRHQVLHKGGPCGTILVDSKNRQSWQSAYVTKLREDQMAAKADYAILATTVFPSGKKELYIDEETRVIVVNRARAVEVAGLLRRAMVRMHVLGLGQNERAEKRELLYKYITSEDFRQHVIEAGRLTTEMLDLDAEEKRAHDTVWEKRGKMTTRLRNVVRDVDTEVCAIVEGRCTSNATTK